MNPAALNIALERLYHELDEAYQARIERIMNSSLSQREQAAILLKREPAMRKAIDEACRCWIKNEKCQMSAEDADLLYERMNEAHRFGKLCSGEEFGEALTVADVLALLLIEHWETGGETQWRELLTAQP
jgi:hypothetical protein